MYSLIMIALLGGCGDGNCSVSPVSRFQTVPSFRLVENADCQKCSQATASTGFCGKCGTYNSHIPISSKCAWTYKNYSDAESFRISKAVLKLGSASREFNIPVLDDRLPKIKCERDMRDGTITRFICDYGDKIPYYDDPIYAVSVKSEIPPPAKFLPPPK